MGRGRAQRTVRSAAAAVRATVGCVCVLLVACGLPLGGLGVGPHDGSADAGEGDVRNGPNPEPVPTGDARADPADVANGDDADVANGDDADVTNGDDADAAPDATGGADEGGRDAGEAETGPPPKPSFVQVSYATPQEAKTSLGVAYAMPQAAGDLNVVVVGWNDSVAQVQSVSDSAGNDYALAIGPTVNVGIFTQSVYYAANIAAAGKKNTVTVQFSAPAPAIDLRVLEYQGIDPIDPLDVSAGAMGTGSTSNAGPVVTTAPDLLVAANMVEFLTTAPGTGFTQRTLTSPDSDIVEDVFAPSPGGYSAAADITPMSRWVMQIVAFRVK
jgi:hypothetical protein